MQTKREKWNQVYAEACEAHENGNSDYMSAMLMAGDNATCDHEDDSDEWYAVALASLGDRMTFAETEETEAWFASRGITG